MNTHPRNDIEAALCDIKYEYLTARGRFPKFNTAHEGFAVLKEEVDELWDEVKSNNREAAKGEALQVAAMALAFILEIEKEAS